MQQVTNKETEILLELLGKILDAGVEGDVVEMGCYRGDTSLLFQRALGGSEKRLWLYDSFEGLPDKGVEDNSVAGDQFRAGELFVTKREVVTRFKKAGLEVPIIRKKFFEELDAEVDLPEKIAFAFLDGDLYRSIKTSWGLVWPKMQKGGVVVIHDYNNPELPGVAKAVDEIGRDFQVKESLVIIKAVNEWAPSDNDLLR